VAICSAIIFAESSGTLIALIETLNTLPNFLRSFASNSWILAQSLPIITQTLEAKIIISHSLFVFLITTLLIPDLG
jgi:hypothetical protein